MKEVLVEDLSKAIKVVAASQPYVPPHIAQVLAQHGKASDLTDREREVLHLVVKGLNNKEIGRTLGFSENTAEFNVKNSFTKLHVSDRTEAATAVLQRGIIR